ncbi:MAG: sensor histidine kinase [Flavisolibacter sp.]
MAQPGPHFLEDLTTREGLSSNKINDLLQDDDGFLWIATTDGLNRFDGTEKLHYYHKANFNSIPHNYVFCLEKLLGNYIAVGTQGGLGFLNTRTNVFENFYLQEKTLTEFNNIIIDFETDAMGNLWAIARNCIFIFNKNRKHIKTFFSPFTKEDASRQRLKFIEKTLSLPDGNMLIYRYDGWYIYSATMSQGIPLKTFLTQNRNGLLTQMVRLQMLERNNLYFPPASIFKIFGRFFLCIKPNADSLLLIDEKGKQQTAIYFPYNKFPYLSWSQQAVVIDSTTVLFLFHSFGLARIKVLWKNNQPHLASCSGVWFEDHEFKAALRDRQYNWWLGTSQSGLRKVSPYKQNFQKTVLLNQKGEAAKSETVSLSRYRQTLWISTYGDGFYEKDFVTGNTRQHLLPADSADPWINYIWNVRQFHKDSLWLGTQVGLFWYCLPAKTYGRVQKPGKPSALDSNAITTQFTDSHGIVWMGIGRGKGLCRFDTKRKRFEYLNGKGQPKYPLRYPTHIVEDSHSNLWFVNDGSPDLVHWNRDNDLFQTIKLAPFKRISDLTAIANQNDSILWIGTLADGLLRFHIPTRTTKIYGHDKGIGDSHVNAIFQDQFERTWVGTYGNVSCLDPQTELFTNYTAKDGLPVEFPTCPFYYEPGEAHFYGAGHGMLFSFDPGRMGQPQSPQKTLITDMEVNGEPFMFIGKEGKFKPTQNDITLHYSAIDLTNGPETQYAYKLKGDDTAWINVGHQRQINFSNLAPGNYTFMVRASNNMGAWSDEAATVQFSIRKKFSQTAWFYGLILVVMGAVFYGLYRFRLRQLLRTEEVRSEISKNLHDEVGSALTNISLGTLLAQKQLRQTEPVRSLLERIYQDSQHASESMREIIWSIDPKIDTIEDALPRMIHYASELLEARNIEVKTEMSTGTRQMKLSMQQRRDLYMIFKETINNLAKHSMATEVQIKWNYLDNGFTMLIADNGMGFNSPGPPDHHGLRNMKERAQRQGWSLDINSVPGSGTTVMLKAQIA